MKAKADEVKKTLAAGVAAAAKCAGKTGDELTKCTKAAKWAGKDCTKETGTNKTECEAAKSSAKFIVASAMTVASMVSLM